MIANGSESCYFCKRKLNLENLGAFIPVDSKEKKGKERR